MGVFRSLVVMKLKVLQLSKLKPSRLIIILLIIIILVTTSLMIGYYENISSDYEEVVAVATVDKTMARIGSLFHFSSNESKGKITHQYWTFGDGTNSEDLDPNHMYEFTGLYNVTLTVFCKDGSEDNTTLQVGTQYEDYSVNLNTNRDNTIMLNGRSGPAIYGVFGPNAGNPKVILQGTVIGAIGEFELDISIEAERQWQKSIYAEPISARGENLQFDVIITPEEIPEYAQYPSSLIRLVFYTTTGRYSGIDLTMTVEFPLDPIVN